MKQSKTKVITEALEKHYNGESLQEGFFFKDNYRVWIEEYEALIIAMPMIEKLIKSYTTFVEKQQKKNIAFNKKKNAGKNKNKLISISNDLNEEGVDEIALEVSIQISSTASQVKNIFKAGRKAKKEGTKFKNPIEKINVVVSDGNMIASEQFNTKDQSKLGDIIGIIVVPIKSDYIIRIGR